MTIRDGGASSAFSVITATVLVSTNTMLAQIAQATSGFYSAGFSALALAAGATVDIYAIPGLKNGILTVHDTDVQATRAQAIAYFSRNITAPALSVLASTNCTLSLSGNTIRLQNNLATQADFFGQVLLCAN